MMPSVRPAAGLRSLTRWATPEPLSVRVGIASGLVVVGTLIGAGAAQERGVVGAMPNLAARLQALARQGTLVVDCFALRSTPNCQSAGRRPEWRAPP